MSTKRKSCPWCKEELSLSAYYRHLKDNQGLFCPNRRNLKVYQANLKSSDCPSSDSDILDSDCESTKSSDSSFSFGESDRINQSLKAGTGAEPGIDDCDVLSLGDSHDSSLDDVDAMLDEVESDLEEEIWEDSSSDDSDSSETSPKSDLISNQLVYGVCFFLNFFQLFYKISENAILAFLAFLRLLLSFLGRFCPANHPLNNLASLLPKSIYSIKKTLRDKDNGLTEYVVCPVCSTLYLFEHCIVRQNGCNESKVCEYIKYPNHPHPSRRKKCNTTLLKRIKVGSKSKLIPRKIFVYHSIIHGLKQLLCRPGFLKKCEHWRVRDSVMPADTFSDIYDGQIWRDLQTINNHPFLSLPNNLCLMLNVDWFNPYDETPYSAGVAYFVITNLPRSERFKLENVIIAGLIPGPTEPKKTMNSYLTPIVNDLVQLFNGVVLPNSSSFTNTTLVRAVLCCVSCDLPACRKVCGFYSFSALKGCSKCLKEFPTESFGSKPDYSGYDVENWVKRDNATQLRTTLLAKEAPTASRQQEIEQSYGARYTELSRLTYFDCIRHHVIDPMHNLFLGIAKHNMTVWKELDIITAKDLETIQEKVDSMNPPPKVGRIPRKLQSGFFSITADEWKNWLVLYSPYALYNIVQPDHYKCWCCFVEACQLICKPIVTKTEVIKAHDLLISYCKSFQQLYGTSKCTQTCIWHAI